MQDSTIRNSPETSKPTTRRKITQSKFLEVDFVTDSHSENENLASKQLLKSKLQSVKKEESLLFKRSLRRNRNVEQKKSRKSSRNRQELSILEEKGESDSSSSLVKESFNSNNNNLNSNVFLASTDEASSCSSINSQNSLDQFKLANWGLPKQILKKYQSRGIKSMFPWQVECLSNERIIRENRNIIYSAPTSAGKTLVAEILLLKTVLERQKKVIFILPFVSVVREKMFYFQDLLSDSGVRVEGFMGGVAPAGGFQSVNIAIATIEKANSLINRLMEEEDLMSVGAVVIDELHLLGDPNRGYILELLLTKLRYISLKYEDINIQLIGMSATLPNLSMLADWLNAELYKTDFRPIPLDEQCKIDSTIYNRELQLIRELSAIPEITNDTDNIIQLCIETIEGGHSVLIFCPTKNWCEKLALQMASAFFSIGRSNSHLGQVLQTSLDASAIFETLEQLKRTPTGLDSVLRNTVSFGVAFHHAGLTMDERDIIEGSFRTGSLKVLVATSTLSTGVNLPARRVIIRSPSFHGRPLDTLAYRQMIGRAGRMGKDTAGESILICKTNERAIAQNLLTASLEPIVSCLEDSGPLMRSLLEAVASDIVRTPEDLDCYIKCTFIHLQEEGEGSISNAVKEAVEFLVVNEFLMLQESEEEHLKRWSATPLGKACLAASVPPKEGLFLFEELLKARKCIALDTELHVVYLVTPYSLGSQIGQIDWMNYLEMWSKLSEPEKRVAKLVGVEERFLMSAVRGNIASGKTLNIHKRFYTALALYELVREIPLHKVCKKFGCGRGLLQSLQQTSSTYAGMITSFCKQLNWSCMELLVAQFQTRLQFGVSRDLVDLLRLPSLNGLRARSLYKEGITSIVELAVANELEVERALHKALPFESEKDLNGDGQFELARQNKVRTTFITGKDGLTTREAATLLIREARSLLQNELGIRDVQWNQQTQENPTNLSNALHQNSSNIAEHSGIIQESNSKTKASENLEIVNRDEENAQDIDESIKTQNSSIVINKEFNKSKKDKNSSRSRKELTIERTRVSQKNQDSVSQKDVNLDESSEFFLEPLVLSASSLPISQRSVYENINKEVESALEEALLNNCLSNENLQHDNDSSNSPNLFDSEFSMNDCSALEQNVLGSLQLSDFEMTNISNKRSSDCFQSNSLNTQEQEVFKKPKMVETNAASDQITFSNFDVNFYTQKRPEEKTNKKKDENVGADLEITFFDEAEFNTVLGRSKKDTNEENNEQISELRLSDFELTVPKKQVFEEIPNQKETISGNQSSEFKLSKRSKSQEISRKTEAKEPSKRSETFKKSEEKKAEDESIKNYLSGINASDFEITNQNKTILKVNTTNLDVSKPKISDAEISKPNEFLSGINISDFELSKMPLSRLRKENTKQILNKENSPSKLTSTNLSKIKSNINLNTLQISKTRVPAKTSQDLKKKSDSISFWDQDSWDNVQVSKKEPNDKKKIKSNESNSKMKETLPKKKNVQKDTKKPSRNVKEKRKFSVAEGSPIASIETYEKQKISVASSGSDSDDMFMLPKKIKVSDRTVINTNIGKIEPRNLAKTDFSKPGPSKIQLKNPRRSTSEKLIRKSLEFQSSFDSLIFSDEDSAVENSIDEKVFKSNEIGLKVDKNLPKWKPASIISSKKMLTVLREKLAKRNDIALALHYETITKSKIIIGAKILGAENNEENKKPKPEKFVYGDKKVCGVSISWGFQALYYIPLSSQSEVKVSLKERLNFLVEVLTNSAMNVRCFSLRKIYKLLYQCCGIIPSCKFIDPTVADWYLNSEEKYKNINYLVTKYYPVAHDYFENHHIFDDDDKYTEINSAKEAVLVWYITEVLLKTLGEKSKELLTTFKDVEMQILPILSRMELRGLGVNLPALQELSDVIKREISLLENRAFYLAGKKFNFMSSTSVAQVLGLQKGKTSKGFLEQCDHPISKLIISWRKLNTLQTLVVIPLLNEARNSRIHGSHITHTVTGRISMHEPNLQNIPKDFTSEDNTFVISIRMAFIPSVCNIMLSADYCQLELRILAHFSNDPVLRSIMRKEGTDIFKSISAKWNNIDESMVDDQIRQRTKQLCYGMIYGMGTKSLAESLSVTEPQAKEFLETFMRTYKGIRTWLLNAVERARIDGYVTTVAKRHRMLPGIWSENRTEKSQAERQAINTKIQGSAADIAKKAMVLIDKKLQEEFPSSPVIFPSSRNTRKLRSSDSGSEFRGAYLVLQLHDELLFEVNASDLHHVAKLVKESMEKAYSLEVPLPVKLKVGPAWGDLNEYNF